MRPEVHDPGRFPERGCTGVTQGVIVVCQIIYSTNGVSI